jgi:hypothetical protein
MQHAFEFEEDNYDLLRDAEAGPQDRHNSNKNTMSRQHQQQRRDQGG